jgi:hypothetical protein
MSPRSIDLPVGRKGWVIKTLEAQVSPILLGCKCPVSQGIVVQEQDPLGDFRAAFFKMPLNRTGRDG